MSTFAEWQPVYAKHHVATFPVTIDGDKTPSVRGYLKTGLRGSGQLALKFADAESFGFACGSYNRLTIVDMDDTDPTIVSEGERLFGSSPLLWRTGGGNYAMPYRYNGEGRRIRPIPSLPIDLLGGGFCVAPPSMGAVRQYEIIRGSLADLDRLPKARIPDEIAQQTARGLTRGRIPEGRRNNELFRHCKSIVDRCDTVDDLIDAAKTWAENRLAVPLSSPEIVKTCCSVWQYRGGRKRVMNTIVESAQFEALTADVSALGVMSYLSAENGPDSEFMIADALAEARGWPRRVVPKAREKMLEIGLIECVRKPGNGLPALYRWAKR
jgi:Primase C terminal 1 (PriCT-1)